MWPAPPRSGPLIGGKRLEGITRTRGGNLTDTAGSSSCQEGAGERQGKRPDVPDADLRQKGVFALGRDDGAVLGLMLIVNHIHEHFGQESAYARVERDPPPVFAVGVVARRGRRLPGTNFFSGSVFYRYDRRSDPGGGLRKVYPGSLLAAASRPGRRCPLRSSRANLWPDWANGAGKTRR